MTRLALLAVPLFCAMGCGTVFNVCTVPMPKCEYLADGAAYPDRIIYGGAFADVAFGAGLILFESTNELWAAPVGLYMLVVDLPMSLVGDTLTLPITVPATIGRCLHPSNPHRRPCGATDGTEAGDDSAISGAAASSDEAAKPPAPGASR